MMIEKFTDFVNESSQQSLNDIKRNIYSVAKKEYMNAVAKEIKANGIKVIKIIDSESEDFSNDSFTCSYKSSKEFKIKMSIRGVSLAPDLEDISGQYSTKVSAMVKKIDSVLNNGVKR
jgi:uncharacterized protein YnzC (UPF0291/DUF896 family)